MDKNVLLIKSPFVDTQKLRLAGLNGVRRNEIKKTTIF